MTGAPAPSPARRVAVVGAGWAGLAAAVAAVRAGAQVEVFDTARQPGGRARTVEAGGRTHDNGQHILIGAYTETLALMRTIGVDPDRVLQRHPLSLCYPDGHGLQARGGPAALAFAGAVWRQTRWPRRERLAVLLHAARWALAGFRAEPGQTVADLIGSLPADARERIFEPLCVAALNTPAASADAQVFLRVLRDALFSGPGSADLLLPRARLGALLPVPAVGWLTQHGAPWHPGRRVTAVAPAGHGGWTLETSDSPAPAAGAAFDAVVLACGPAESARLAAGPAPAWAQACGALPYEPIVTVTLAAPGLEPWPCPMMALPAGPQAPAQYAFDLGALGLEPGHYTFVISGASAWVDAGREVTADAVITQAAAALGPLRWPQRASCVHLAMEKRATFRCEPGLRRPPATIAPGLWAAGDHVAGPYPATLEGAVRSGLAAGRAAAHP